MILRPWAWTVGAAFLCLVAPTSAPGAAQIPPEPPPEVRIVAELDWGADTVVLEPDLLGGAAERGDRAGVLRLPRGRDEVASLRPGQIVVFRGAMMRRIQAVGREGEAVRLETEEVPLTAALRNARIAMEVPMGALFQKRPESAARWPRRLGLPGTAVLVLGDAAVPLTGLRACTQKSVSGFDIEACLEQKDATSLGASLEITKKHAGRQVAKFTAEGVFGGVLKPEIRISNHQLDLFDFRAEKFHSQFKVKVAALAPGGKIQLELPPILEFPFLVGGAIPVVLKVKMYTSLETILPGELASVDVDLDFRFDGDYGFSYTGGSDVATFASGLRHAPSLTEGSLASDSHAFMKFNVGVPRIEFGVFGGVLVPWFQNAISLSGYYTAPFQPASCRELNLVSVQAAGYEFKLLGFSKQSSRTINRWPLPPSPLLKIGQCD